MPTGVNAGLDHGSIYDAVLCNVLKVSPVADRELNGYSLATSKANLPKAKALIREFASRFIELIETSGDEAEEIYQLNVQFFKLSKLKKEK